MLWFALYTCLYRGGVGYEQIVNTGPLYTVNVVLTSIDRGVPRPVLRFCSGVFPLEVSAISTFNAGVSYLLWNHGPSKHRRAERQLPHPLPFTLYSYPLSNRGAMARASSADVPAKYDDVVLIQLVLTQLAKCSPFPQLMVSQADWP